MTDLSVKKEELFFKSTKTFGLSHFTHLSAHSWIGFLKMFKKSICLSILWKKSLKSRKRWNIRPGFHSQIHFFPHRIKILNSFQHEKHLPKKITVLCTLICHSYSLYLLWLILIEVTVNWPQYGYTHKPNSIFSWFKNLLFNVNSIIVSNFNAISIEDLLQYYYKVYVLQTSI